MWYPLPKGVVGFLVPLVCVMWYLCSSNSVPSLSKMRFFPTLDPCYMEPLFIPCLHLIFLLYVYIFPF